MRIRILAVCLFFFLQGSMLNSQIVKEYSPVSEKVEADLFEDAVRLIKRYEGWHHARDHPDYVGYGHRLLPTDTFRHDISESFADSILRNDLKQKCVVFRHLGMDSLLLGVLSFNVGENKVLRSKLIRKLKAGDRNVREEYLSFCHYKGKVVRSLKRRREEEYNLLVITTNLIHQ